MRTLQRQLLLLSVFQVLSCTLALPFPVLAMPGTPVISVNGQAALGGRLSFPATNVIQIAMQTSFTNGAIYYTLDGTMPDPGSPLYVDPFFLTNAAIIRAVAFNEDYNESAEADPVEIALLPFYRLTITTKGQGSVSLDPAGGFYLSNSAVTLTATPEPGWLFEHWKGGAGGQQNPMTITMLASVTVEAVFSPIPSYTIQTSTLGGGTISVSPSNGPYLSNTVITLTASNAPGWAFLNWTGDACSTNAVLSLPMDTNKNVRAAFGTPIKITISPAGYGSVLRSPSQELYPYGSELMLSAIPQAGKFFSFWSGAGSGFSNSPLCFTITNPTPSITAVFGTLSPDRRTLTVLVNGNGNVQKVPQQAHYEPWQVVMLTPTPATNYLFDGWSGDATGSDNPLRVVLDSSKVVTANFSLRPPMVAGSPGSQTITVGDPVTFCPAIEGGPPLHYQWQFNGNDLPNETNQCLTISHVGEADAGEYRVIVTNLTGRTVSAGAALNVVPVVIVAWGESGYGKTSVPTGLTNIVDISAGDLNSVALTGVGQILSWGYHYVNDFTPQGREFIGISDSVGSGYCLGLKSNRTVVGWGNNQYGQLDIPTSLTNVTQIVAGLYHGIAVLTGGMVVTWGGQGSETFDHGIGHIPPGLSNVIDVAATGSTRCLALKGDGTVSSWGWTYLGLTEVPSDITNAVAIAAGGTHNLVLRSDGTIVPWGARNDGGQLSVPENLNNVVAIAAGDDYSLALKRDGTLVGWGGTNSNWLENQTNNIPSLTNVTAISFKRQHGLALLGNGLPRIREQPQDRNTYASLPALFRVQAIGTMPLKYQWQCNGRDIPAATNFALFINAVQPSNSGAYAVVISNVFGAITSSPAILNVPDEPPAVISQARDSVVTVGRQAQFEVTAFGPGALSYQWRHNHLDIPGATNAMLVLSNVTFADAGEYSVLVSNYNGITVSSNANLEVVPAILRTSGWGLWGTCDVPSGLTDIVAIAAGTTHALALRRNGTVVGWGDNYFKQVDVPADLSNITAIVCGEMHSLALRRDGTVVGWGKYSECQIPADLTNAVAIAAGSYGSMALKSDGTVAQWGYSDYKTNLNQYLTNIIAISRNGQHRVGVLRNNGTIMTWQPENIYGEPNVPKELAKAVDIDCGAYQDLALREDGTVTAWGDNTYGQTNSPPGLANVIDVASGGFFNLVLKDDGTVAAWGDNTYGQTDVPTDLTNVTAIAAGYYFSLALVGTGAPFIYSQPVNPASEIGASSVFHVTASGAMPLSYQWYHDGMELPGATKPWLVLTNLQLSNSGTYYVVVSNAFGILASSNAVLTVTTPDAAPVIRLTAPGDGNIFNLPTNILFQVEAHDPDGIVVSVEFFAKQVGSISAPLSLGLGTNAETGLFAAQVLWTNASPGFYSITVKATDELGLSAFSAPITISVINLSQPAIVLYNPVNEASFSAPADVPISFSASDSSGTITLVHLYAQLVATNSPGFLIGTFTNGGASLMNVNTTWTNVGVGSYWLTGVAYNDSGGAVTSAPVLVNVRPSTPLVSITSPTNGASYNVPVNITICANAADLDGPILSVDIFEGTNLLGSLTNRPYSFTWTNVPQGTYILKAQATDAWGLTGVSSPVVVGVGMPTNPPVFQLSSASYQIDEGAGMVMVTVLKGVSGGPAGVNYATVDGSAQAGQDYRAVSGYLDFAPGDMFKTVGIPVLPDFLYQGNRSFSFRLSAPSGGGSLANPSEAVVTILDDEVFSTNSCTDIRFPAAVPPHNGSLRVEIAPDIAGGQWRLLGELSWRDGGTTVAGLAAGNYDVEFKPVSGYLQPTPTQVPVPANQPAELSVLYNPIFAPQLGTLQIMIKPDSVASNPHVQEQGQWRLQGETNWHNSGEMLANVNAGVHIVEFKTIANWTPPQNMGATVVADEQVVITGTYSVAQAPFGSTPGVLPYVTVQQSDQKPYRFNGQIRTPLGYGSGVVVKEKVVLTAAHVLFDEGTCTYVTDMQWLFQRDGGPNGEYEPLPQSPRGVYLLEGYAAQRQLENSPGQSSLESYRLDVGVMYFNGSAGRGGYGGYLVSDANNQWLLSAQEKMLVGYPMDWAIGANQGRLHATVPGAVTFGAFEGYPELFSTALLHSYGGNSGGPLYVQSTNNGPFCPAGVYLGGTENKSVVRVIDATVVDLIRRAEISSNGGTNHTGGGVVYLGVTSPIPGIPIGYLNVNISPSSVLRAGAAWQVVGFTNKFYTTNTVAAVAGTYPISFVAVPGFTAPGTMNATVVSGQTMLINAAYRPIPGYLQVHLAPPNAIAAGADWQVGNATNHYRSDQMISLTEGTYPVTFSPVPGFVPPPPRNVNILSGQTTRWNAEYIPFILQMSPTQGLGVPNVTGMTYRIQFTPSLQPPVQWSNVLVFSNLGQWVPATLPTNGPQGYYRSTIGP